jgi:modification methylase
MPTHIRIAGQEVHFHTSEDMSDVKDSSVQLFVTSPPYWHLKDYGTSEQIGDSSYEEYLERLCGVWDECYVKAANNAVLIINVNNRRVKKQFVPIALDIAQRMRGWKLWDINHWYVPNALPQPNHYRERLLDNKTEYLLVFTKDGSVDYKFHKPRVPQKYRDADPRGHKKSQT